MGKVLLVRHGETTWNRTGRVQGWAPTPLTERGRAQAETVAAHIASEHDPDRVYASDLRRARETARYVARETECDVRTDPAWRERDFGRLQGLKAETLREEHPEFSVEGADAEAAARRPESGESLVDARDRVLAGWRRLVADLSGETAVVVAHSGPVRLVCGHLEGLDAAESMRRAKDNCAVTEVTLGDEPTIACENDTSFLRDRPSAADRARPRSDDTRARTHSDESVPTYDS